MVFLNPADASGQNRDGFWKLNGRRRPSSVSIPPGTMYLWLDPAFTTPNVVMGVKTGAGSFLMAPGDVVPLGGRDLAATIWNANRDMGIDLMPSTITAGLVGFFGLRAIRNTTELSAVMASKQRKDPAGVGSVLYAGRVSDDDQVAIITANLTGLRISVVPIATADNAPMAVNAVPADLAGTVQFLTFQGGIPARAAWTAPVGVVSEPLDVNPIDQEAPASVAITAINSDQTLNIGQYVRTWDRQVAASSGLVALVTSITVCTGGFLTHACLVVEGR